MSELTVPTNTTESTTTQDKQEETATTNENVSTDDNNKELLLRISERLCFFFSNANLRRDKFLQKILLENSTPGHTTEKGGFVPIQTLLTFNTLKKITTDASKIIQTVKEEDECQSLLCLNESETAVGRIQPFTKEMITSTEYESRTIRIGNVPLSSVVTTNTTTTTTTTTTHKQYAVGIEEIQHLFSQYGKVSMVQLIYNNFHHRHEKGGQQQHSERNPIGKAFVEFETMDGYNAAVKDLISSSSKDNHNNKEGNEEDIKKPTILILGGNELTVKTMEQHLEKQAMKRAAAAAKRSRNDIEKEEEEQQVQAPIVEYTWQKGCIVHLEGLSETATQRESILKVITNFWNEIVQVRVDYQMGQKEGHLRFEQPSEKIITFVQALKEKTLLIDGNEVQAKILEGEEEDKYQKKYHDFLQKRKQIQFDEARNKKQFRGKNNNNNNKQQQPPNKKGRR